MDDNTDNPSDNDIASDIGFGYLSLIIPALGLIALIVFLAHCGGGTSDVVLCLGNDASSSDRTSSSCVCILPTT